MARPSMMEDDDLREAFTDLYVAGAKRADMADAFAVDVKTISTWTKRPDVQALISAKREQRANRILRKVESAIEARLESPEGLSKLDFKDLLAIKREFTPKRVEVGAAGSFGEAAELEAWAALDAGDDLPALAAGDELIEGSAFEEEDHGDPR